MTSKPFLVPLFILLVSGCSQESTQSPGSTATREQHSDDTSDTALYESLLRSGPFEIKVVKSPGTKEIEETREAARSLFKTADYKALDALAAQYRSSKEGYAPGSWRLGVLYDGLSMDESEDDAAWTKHLDSFRAWIKANPESITPRVALAAELASYAWKARGSGYADTVTQQGWERFRQRLEEAVRVLIDAKKLEQQCPRWYSAMLTAALGLQMDRAKYDLLFQEAIRSHPDYHEYYSSRAYFLLPRWYGEEGEWQADLTKWADKLGGDVGDLLYARVVWRMHRGRFYNNIFRETGVSWERVDNGFALMQKRYPDSLSAQSERAYLAVLARDYERARTYFDRLEGKVDLSVWRTTNNFARFARSVYARTGEPTE